MEYRAGLKVYEATDLENLSCEKCDALADATYRPAYYALCKPLPAVTTRDGAKAALLLIRDESMGFAESPLIPALADALLAWVGADV
jgi:hypothetical protein